MKKVLAVMLILAFVLSCATAYAGGADKACSTSGKISSSAGSGKGFFNEAADLFRKQIPATEKSKTHNLWKVDDQKARVNKG